MTARTQGVVAALVSSLVFTVNVGITAQSRSAAPSRDAAVSRFIRAAQSRDFKTIVDVAAQFQSEIAAIKAQNPQVLWSRLLQEYSDGKIAQISKSSVGYWEEYSQTLLGAAGDPTQAIRAAVAFLPKTAAAAISENPTETRCATTYVTITHSTGDP